MDLLAYALLLVITLSVPIDHYLEGAFSLYKAYEKYGISSRRAMLAVSICLFKVPLFVLLVLEFILESTLINTFEFLIFRL
jgi:hypothetical protein